MKFTLPNLRQTLPMSCLLIDSTFKTYWAGESLSQNMVLNSRFYSVQPGYFSFALYAEYPYNGLEAVNTAL
jgi:hypothetical protein